MGRVLQIKSSKSDSLTWLNIALHGGVPVQICGPGLDLLSSRIGIATAQMTGQVRAYSFQILTHQEFGALWSVGSTLFLLMITLAPFARW